MSTHDKNCAYHVDQYDFECTCRQSPFSPSGGRSAINGAVMYKSDAIAGRIAVELQARNRFIDIATMRSIVHDAINAALKAALPPKPAAKPQGAGDVIKRLEFLRKHGLLLDGNDMAFIRAALGVSE